jgi:hypothetical protein
MGFMRIFWLLWKKLAELRFIWRLAIKLVIFGGVLVVVLYPHPGLFFKQLHNYLDFESLIQPNFSEIGVINREIDAMLLPDATRENEFKVIQRYVYQHIRYEYDWKNWGNIDFWPTAEQVWERKKEDCDGQAILAVSILQSRGFETAKLVGNIRHVWVAVDRQELMGPDKEQTLRLEGGRITITRPSLELILNTTALYIADFPAIRNLILFFTFLLLCYHPCRNLTRFLGMTTLGLVGFILLKDWAQDLRADDVAHLNGNFIIGCSLICVAMIFSLFTKNKRRDT